MKAFFGFKKTAFCDHPDPKVLFPSQSWNQAKAACSFWPSITARAASRKESTVGESTLLDATTEALL